MLLQIGEAAVNFHLRAESSNWFWISCEPVAIVAALLLIWLAFGATAVKARQDAQEIEDGIA
jgi:hypothetical protein